MKRTTWIWRLSIGILLGSAGALAYSLTGCFVDKEETEPQAATHKLADAVYVKDRRTGLCFLSRGLGFNWAVLTNVPCTEAVEREIAKDAPACPAK